MILLYIRALPLILIHHYTSHACFEASTLNLAHHHACLKSFYGESGPSPDFNPIDQTCNYHFKSRAFSFYHTVTKAQIPHI